MSNRDLREKFRELTRKLIKLEDLFAEDLRNGVFESSKVSLTSRDLATLLDLIDRYEAALMRIVKPCAYNDSPLNDCDCLSGNECAEIAREALNDRGTDRV